MSAAGEEQTGESYCGETERPSDEWKKWLHKTLHVLKRCMHRRRPRTASRLLRHEYDEVTARPESCDQSLALAFAHILGADSDREQFAAARTIDNLHAQAGEHIRNRGCRGIVGKAHNYGRSCVHRPV